MPKWRLEAVGGQPLLDIASYARPGPSRRDRLSRDDLDLITRTARRVPEVMVKVLTHGRQDPHGVQRHLVYITRGDELNLETDDDDKAERNSSPKELLEDWDLDLEDYRRRAELSAVSGRRPPKLVHKVMFSMPAGTPPQKVLAAVRNLAREQFGGTHRYAMALHTDEPHPHVHMVVKAVSEEGVRLNIRKETLRVWRSEFARHLRALGVAANATERAVRGQARTPKLDGIYRAMRRGESTHVRGRIELVASELLQGSLRLEAGKKTLLQTRREVESGWKALEDRLINLGRSALAEEVSRFARQMPRPSTEKEAFAHELTLRAERTRVRT